MDKEKVASIIESIADKYESGEIGWIQQRYSNDDGDYCMLGAIFFELQLDQLLLDKNYNVEYLDVVYALEQDLEPINGPFPGNKVSRFNDQNGQTKDRIIDQLKLTAKRLRNESQGRGTIVENAAKAIRNGAFA